MTPLFIPSPSEGVWYLGPLPIRGYALCIILGIVAAIWIGERRWVARGGTHGRGQRHRALGGAVRPGRRPALPRDHRPRPLLRRRASTPINALYVWRGGLGIWGAIALGAVGVWIGAPTQGHPGAAAARRAGSRRPGRPGHRPLGQLVQPGAVRPADRPAVGAGDRPAAPAARATSSTPPSTRRSSTSASGTSAAFGFVIWADRRFRLGHGRVIALYVMVYTPAAAGSRCCASTRASTTTCSGCGSTSGPRSCCSSWRRSYFVVVGRRHPGRDDGVTPRSAWRPYGRVGRRDRPGHRRPASPVDAGPSRASPSRTNAGGRRRIAAVTPSPPRNASRRRARPALLA